jgi:hypothetical protein
MEVEEMDVRCQERNKETSGVWETGIPLQVAQSFHPTENLKESATRG